MTYDRNCVLCNPHKDPEQRIVLENETCFFLQHDSQQDILEGSGLVVPKQHHENPFEMTREEWADTYEILQRARAILDAEFEPDGYTLGWNVGKASNQEIFHSHLHVIPRYQDEPLAGKGIRYWLKQENNRRTKAAPS